MNLNNGHELVVILGSIAGSGLGVYVVSEVFKKVLKLDTAKRDAIIHTMVVAVTGVFTAAQYVIQFHSSISPAFGVISGGSIYGVSQVIFKYKNYIQDFVNAVRAYNDKLDNASSPVNDASVASVTAPADLVSPVAEATASTANF